MPKQILTGTLDEQCAFLYQMAQEKMSEGNYTGAVHALKDVVKHKPNFREANQLLMEAQQRKSEQTKLVIAGFTGAAFFIGVGTVAQASNDFVFLGLAVLGAVVGYLIGTLLLGQRGKVYDKVTR